MTSTISLKDLFGRSNPEIVSALSGVYEHSSWVAETLVKKKDVSQITTVSSLAVAMKSIVNDAPTDKKLELLRLHPDLGTKVEKLKDLTKESQEEQSKAGLQTMEGDELEKFYSLNSRYREKFHFPFILAVRNASKHTVLSALEGRLPNSKEQEMVTALQQVHNIAWMRILSKLESDSPAGYLTCHVLDTANGCPGTSS